MVFTPSRKDVRFFAHNDTLNFQISLLPNQKKKKKKQDFGFL